MEKVSFEPGKAQLNVSCKLPLLLKVTKFGQQNN